MKQSKKNVYILVMLCLTYLLVFASLYSLFSFTSIYPKRYSAAPLEQNIDFWQSVREKILNTSNLQATKNKTRTYLYEGLTLNETHYTMWSERYGGRDIWVNVVVLHNGSLVRRPCVIMVHGYGGNWMDMKVFMEVLAKHGYVVVAIDAPGASGNSTDYPQDSPENIINATDGPQYAYFYHVAYAVMRTITFVKTLSFVDPSRIIVGGVSMGGLMSIITGAVDDRVYCIFPIVAAGNYLDSILSGSFANGLIPKEKSLEDLAAKKTLEYFDLYGYARRINIPVLLVAATNDEYFNLIAFNDTFNAFASNNKTLVIWPNSDHYGYPYWSQVLMNVIIEWLDKVLKGAKYPKIDKASVRKSWYILFDQISIETQVTLEGKKLFLIYRSGVALSEWHIIELANKNNKYVGTFSEFVSPLITYYIVVGEYIDGKLIIYSATPIYTMNTKPLLLPLTIIFAILLLILIDVKFFGNEIANIHKRILRFSRKRWMEIVVWILSTVSIFAPALNVAGRTHISIWDFLERIRIILAYWVGIWVAPPIVPFLIASFFFIIIPRGSRTRRFIFLYPILIIMLPHFYTIISVLFVGPRLGFMFSLAIYLNIGAVAIWILKMIYSKFFSKR